MAQQPALDAQLIAFAVMGKSAYACLAHHAMAGNDDRHRIRATGLPDGTGTGGEFSRQLSVLPRLSARNSARCPPHLVLVGRAIKTKVQIKLEIRVIEIGGQLRADFLCKRGKRGLRQGVGREELDA